MWGINSKHFPQIFNDRHVGKVQTFMVDIMMTVMQEGDTIPQVTALQDYPASLSPLLKYPAYFPLNS